MKPEARREARHLREDQGLALNVIAAQLGVSKSSVSRWVRDIVLTPEQQALLATRNPLYYAQLRGQGERSRSARIVREHAQRHGRELARRGDPLHAQGCMLYWAEGTKKRNSVLFTNSDADMLELFLRFLRHCYGVLDERVAFSVNCFAPDGTARLAVHSTFIVQSIYGAIQEYAGIDRPEWLDLA